MKQYRLREGDVTAVDTKTQLTTAGSDTAPGPLVVPQGMKFITGVRVAAVQNMAVATGYGAFIRNGHEVQSAKRTDTRHNLPARHAKLSNVVTNLVERHRPTRVGDVRANPVVSRRCFVGPQVIKVLPVSDAVRVVRVEHEPSGELRVGRTRLDH
jgi:hypothetical protein